MGVSVVICCYNSATRITETLKYLSRQEITSSLSCEIILVSNACSDNTTEIAAAYWASSGTVKLPLRIVEEFKPGLSFAREKGIEVAAYDIIIFCDDDNWLCESYIETAFRIMNGNLNIGIVGGWCEPHFNHSIAPWLDPFLPALAIGKPAENSVYLRQKGKCVNGAGMVIRKKYYNDIRKKGFNSLLADRTQNVLSSGGDTELCWVMMYSGYEIYFDELLYFKHFIPASRLNKEYLLKLTLSSIYPIILLSIYSFLFWNSRSTFGKFFIKELVTKIYSLLYYLPRIILGKYPNYSSVILRQNIKVLGLLICSFSKVRKDFNRIGVLRRILA